MTLQEHLSSWEADKLMCQWAGTRTAREAWEQCERADWLLEWAERTTANTESAVTLAGCACARLALRFIPSGENRPRRAIEAHEKWAKDPSSENLAAWYAASTAASGFSSEMWPCARDRSVAWAASSAATIYPSLAAMWTARAVILSKGKDAMDSEHRVMCLIVRSMLIIPWEESLSNMEIEISNDKP